MPGQWSVIARAVLLVVGVCSAVTSSMPHLDGDILTQLEILQSSCSSSQPPNHFQREHLLSSVDATLDLFKRVQLPRGKKGELLHSMGEHHLYKSRNLSLAERFLRASADHGNPAAQFLVGALLAHQEDSDPAEVMLFYHFAARAGSMEASMALGYRHMHGYNAPTSCDAALRYYKPVADQVMQRQALEAIPIQLYATAVPARLSDDQSKRPQTDAIDRQRAEYLVHRASQSLDPVSLVQAATLVLFSDLFTHQDYAFMHIDTKRYLEQAAALGNHMALALLGHIYAYGLAGTSADIPIAIQYYRSALAGMTTTDNETGPEEDDDEGDVDAPSHAEAANGLGLLFLNGADGMAVDYEKAMTYFKMAVRWGHIEGIYNAAVIMTHTQPRKAIEYLEATAAVGHLRSLFKLARVMERQRFRGLHEEYDCASIVALYKQVGNHYSGVKLILDHAVKAVLDGEDHHAQHVYAIAAELGVDAADHNTAWLMERTENYYASSKRYKQLVIRGALRNDVDAVVRLGDLAYDDSRYRDAFDFYMRAVTLDPRHARAWFSIGYMHEYGLVSLVPDRIQALKCYGKVKKLEASMTYAMVLLELKLIIELRTIAMYETLVRILSPLWELLAENAAQAILSYARTGTTTQDQPKGSAEAETPSLEASRFEPAVVFSSTSLIHLDGVQWNTHASFSIETWLCMSQPAPPLQVLLEYQHGLLLELEQTHDQSWHIVLRSVIDAASPPVVLDLAGLNVRDWNHFAIVVTQNEDEATATAATTTASPLITLFVNGQVVQRLRQRLTRYDRRKTRDGLDQLGILSVGNALTRWADIDLVPSGFVGQLMQFRVWRIPLSSREVQALMHEHILSSHEAPVLGSRQLRSLEVELVVSLYQQDRDSSERGQKVGVFNGIKAAANERAIALRIVHFPPSTPVPTTKDTEES